MDKITVLIVDDHAIVRQGLRTFLDLVEDIEVIGEAANGLEALEQARELQPDVVLLDLVMPELGGIEVLPKLRECCSDSQIIILTSFGEDDKVFPAIRAGAQGYLLKDTPPNEIADAIRDASEGQMPLHPDVVKKLMIHTANNNLTDANPDALTEREMDVLRLIARGQSNREIAEELSISPKTVKTHVSHILDKLHLADRTQAAIYALKNGIE